MAAIIGYATLWNLVNRADRNRNGRLETADAYVLGNVANKGSNPTVTDTFQAMWRGEAGIDGVRMAPADADAAAAELTGGREHLDESQIALSGGAKQALDGVGGEAFDGKISRRELSVALQWGALAIARDGLALSHEAREFFAKKPQAPATPAPVPNPANNWPPPPPATGQAPAWPQAPATPATPVPQAPPTPVTPARPGQGGTTHPYTVFQNYYAAREAVLTRWGGRSGADGFKKEERPLLERACNEIFTTQVGTFEERKAALQRVYQYSSMSYAEYDRLVKQLAQYAGMQGR